MDKNDMPDIDDSDPIRVLLVSDNENEVEARLRRMHKGLPSDSALSRHSHASYRDAQDGSEELGQALASLAASSAATGLGAISSASKSLASSSSAAASAAGTWTGKVLTGGLSVLERPTLEVWGRYQGQDDYKNIVSASPSADSIRTSLRIPETGAREWMRQPANRDTVVSSYGHYVRERRYKDAGGRRSEGSLRYERTEVFAKAAESAFAQRIDDDTA